MASKKSPEPRSVAELSHAVAAILRTDKSSEDGDKLRFRVMALAEEIMNRHNRVSGRDELTREMLRGWVGKIQTFAGLQ